MSAPLFDDLARDGRQAELASIIRRAALIQPFGPNSKAVHEAGGAVHLTPAEAEDAARAVLESAWLADTITRHVEAFRASLVTTIEAAVDACVTTAGLPTFIPTNTADAERTGRLVGLSAAARIVADHPIAKESR